METTGSSIKIMAGVFTALSAAGALYYRGESLDATRAQSKVEQRLDSLQASHHQLETESRELNGQLDSAQSSNLTLTGQVTEVNRLLNRNENLLRNLRNNHSQLLALRDTMQNQVASLTGQSERMTGENQMLANTNTELNQQIETLKGELSMKVPRSVVTADAFRVEVMKPNEKVTAKAKKVHSLVVSFHVPAELGLEGTQEVYLSLNDGQNNAPVAPLSTVTVNHAGASQTIPVHALTKVDFSKGSQPVSLTIPSTDDFKPQTYRASVFTKDAYLGSVEFKLRDSFWFF